jgi:uncharacterized glyoxalase superfamily protein PhnB
MAQTQQAPRDLHTLTPNLVVRDCAKAIEFYKRAFGAEEKHRFVAPDGKSVWHVELRIGDSTFFMNDEMPGMGNAAPTAERPAPVTLWLSVPDCDAAYQRAVGAGARSARAPEDAFWGDRVAAVMDGYGYTWSFATHQKDLSDEELRRAGAEFARRMQAQRAQHP